LEVILNFNHQILNPQLKIPASRLWPAAMSAHPASDWSSIPLALQVPGKFPPFRHGSYNNQLAILLKQFCMSGFITALSKSFFVPIDCKIIKIN
jgi:hypothetical protein